MPRRRTGPVASPIHPDHSTGPMAAAQPVWSRPATRGRAATASTGDRDGDPLRRKPLDWIETAFVTASQRARPAPLSMPASLLGGAPGEQLDLLRFRTRLLRLLDSPTGVFVDGEHISQRVWTYLAARARSERGEWLLAAVGMAFKALKATVPAHLRFTAAELVESDLVCRMVELLAGEAEHEPPFDITAPYLFTRMMDAVRHAATRSRRRSTAPNDDLQELNAGLLSLRLPSPLQLGDPLIVLAELVRDGNLTRLDAALLARTALCGQTRAEAISAVRESLPDDVGERTDEALRGRLEQARGRIRRIYQWRFPLRSDRTPPTGPAADGGGHPPTA